MNSPRDWSKEFNALPDEVRQIGCAMEARTRIQQLQFEKERLKESYERSVSFINGLIKTNESWLTKLEESPTNSTVVKPTP